MELLKLLLIIPLLWGTTVARAQYSETVLKAFEESYVAEKEGDYRKAASFLKKGYQENSYEYNLRLGWLSYKSGAHGESLNYYRKALEILPYSEEARHGLILPLTALGQMDEVVAVYEEILTHNPGSTVTLYRLGMVHYNRKEWQKAFRPFQKLVDLYPFDYDGLLMLAWTSLRLGKTREAKVLFNKVLLYAPGDKSALEGLELLK